MTDRQNYDSQDRASIAASRGKNQLDDPLRPLATIHQSHTHTHIQSTRGIRWTVISGG